MNARFLSAMCSDFPDSLGSDGRKAKLARSVAESMGLSLSGGMLTFRDRDGDWAVSHSRARKIFLFEMGKQTLPGPVSRHLNGLGVDRVWERIEMVAGKKGGALG